MSHRLIVRSLMHCMLAAIFTACSSAPTIEQLASTDYGPKPENYQELVKTYLADRLFDPYTAVYTHWNGPKRGYFGNRTLGFKYGYAVCVGVNAKNQFGGFAGVQSYYFIIRNGAVIQSEFGEDAAAACSHIDAQEK
jgi:hypothetical protein